MEHIEIDRSIFCIAALFKHVLARQVLQTMITKNCSDEKFNNVLPEIKEKMDYFKGRGAMANTLLNQAIGGKKASKKKGVAKDE